MKIQQLISETMNGYEDKGGNEDLHPDAKQWLESTGITDYDVIGPNEVDVNQDIHWGTITAPAGQTGWVKINHVSGNFSWVTESRLMTNYTRPYKEYFPKTVNGDCTIKFDSTGGSQYINASDLPKGSGRGTLTVECISIFEGQIIPDFDIISTYANYNMNIPFIVRPDVGLSKLPSQWNGSLTLFPEADEPIMPPSVINGDLTIQSDVNGMKTLFKIHQHVKQINGHVYIQGVGPLPLISLFRIKGIKAFDCLIWETDDEGIVDGDDKLSAQISRMFNNALQHGDVFEFQETLIEAGFGKWAK